MLQCTPTEGPTAETSRHSTPETAHLRQDDPPSIRFVSFHPSRPSVLARAQGGAGPGRRTVSQTAHRRNVCIGTRTACSPAARGVQTPDPLHCGCKREGGWRRRRGARGGTGKGLFSASRRRKPPAGPPAHATGQRRSQSRQPPTGRIRVGRGRTGSLCAPSATPHRLSESGRRTPPRARTAGPLDRPRPRSAGRGGGRSDISERPCADAGAAAERARGGVRGRPVRAGRRPRRPRCEIGAVGASGSLAAARLRDWRRWGAIKRRGLIRRRESGVWSGRARGAEAGPRQSSRRTRIGVRRACRRSSPQAHLRCSAASLRRPPHAGRPAWPAEEENAAPQEENFTMCGTPYRNCVAEEIA